MTTGSIGTTVCIVYFCVTHCLMMLIIRSCDMTQNGSFWKLRYKFLPQFCLTVDGIITLKYD